MGWKKFHTIILHSDMVAKLPEAAREPVHDMVAKLPLSSEGADIVTKSSQSSKGADIPEKFPEAARKAWQHCHGTIQEHRHAGVTVTRHRRSSWRHSDEA